MDNINILLICAERRISNVIEAAVLDVCYNQALAQFTRTAELNQFVRLGVSEAFRLTILVADHVYPAKPGWGQPVSISEIASAVRSVRDQSSNLLLTVSINDHHCQCLTDAGADCGLKYPFNTDALKSELRWLLKMPALLREERGHDWRQPNLWLRLLHRLKNA